MSSHLVNQAPRVDQRHQPVSVSVVSQERNSQSGEACSDALCGGFVDVPFRHHAVKVLGELWPCQRAAPGGHH
eukprot:CAMPEP_0171966902 /NCGR_PEP_ID=MMETSP0993-20121228/194968_1 /TAXON_ID=483369 /ORGANISM="non described non described, Strain CCMP2098" /LENGTH=72 /DNA_ID=CAMNT_0012616283 /DNA_START=52 /DNA_END=267 /DNA_ORIENTATION=-